MAKNIRRMFAMVLVMCMIVSALPLQALAAEEDPSITVTETMTGGEVTITFTPTENSGESSVVVSGTNESGAAVDLTGTSTTTSNSTTDSQGKVTEVTSTNTVLTGKETPADGSIKDGIKVDYQDGTTTTTVTDANGNLVSEHVVNSGSETKEWDVPEDNGEAEPDVTVGLIPGETTTADGVVEGTLKTETTTKDGTVITETTYEADRTVNATTSKFDITVNDTNTGLVGEEKPEIQGVAPTYDVINGVKEDKGGMFDGQFNSGATSKYANPDNWVMPEGADLRYVGTGEHSKYFVATAYVVYEKDEAGNTIYDPEGNPVIKEIRRYSDEDSGSITIDGEPITELPDNITLKPVYDNAGGSRPFIFMLMDENKNKFYGYCCDLETDAGEGKYYTISNLEDSDYYASEESSQHIRSILMNGYWGTTGVPDEEGNYALGSLELIKQKLIAAIDSGEYPNTELTAPVLDRNNKYQPVLDEDGNVVYATKTMKEMIEGLTSGEALLATQAAVWSYANGNYNVLNGKDGSIVLDPDSYTTNHNPSIKSKGGEAMDDFASAAVDFLYTWLINLKTEDESTIIINDKNFVEDMSITVHEKDDSHPDNADDNQNNDVYNTDLNFKLAFIPGEKDDLLVQITYKDLDGNDVNVIRRLAGTNAEDQDYESIVPEEDGSYVLSGLKLSENKDFNFDLRLEGTQYLENGVYIYEAVGGRHASQNFVGVAEGERNVDVSVGVTVNFDVNENNHVVAKTTWYNEYDPSNPPVTPPTPPTNPPQPRTWNPPQPRTWNPPQINRLANDDVVINEEPIPLASPAITGDSTGLWVALFLTVAFAMVAVNLFDKKRQHEAF